MRKLALSLITIVALLAGVTFFVDAAGADTESSVTEVYFVAAINLSLKQSQKPSFYYNDIRTIATFRVSRADMSSVIFDFSEGDMRVKARKVKDPEDFVHYLTRPGKWSLLGSDGKEVVQFKRIKKVLMDLSGEIPSIVISLSRPAIGMADGLKKGDSIAVEFVWDDEKYPFTLSLADDSGKLVRLENSEIALAKLWQIRATLTLGEYPCPLEVTEFRYGESLLRQLFGM
ncbi:MAG: hypothetical protein ACOX8I_06245 [Bacillota bacterium]|jgi:hypothetical protein